MNNKFKEALQEVIKDLKEDTNWIYKIGVIFIFILLLFPFIIFIRKFSASIEIIVFGTSSILIFCLMVMQKIKNKK